MSSILSLITTPINDATPCGANINYEPEFDTLKNEIGKPGNLDLDIIEQCSVSLLGTKAKDVRVMVFLAYVFLRREQWEQLADLFAGLLALCEKNFDALQPDRERARHLAFKWLCEERFTGALGEKKPAEPDHGHIVRLLESLGKLKPILEQKFPDSPPFPSQFIKNAGFWEKGCAPKVVAPEPAAATAAGGAAPIPVAAAETAMDTPRQAQLLARKAALFLIEKEPLRTMGYRIARSVRWDVLEKAPPAEGGKTQLPGPVPQQRTFFENLAAKGDWKTALEKAEAAFAAGSNHCWIDLQWIIVTAAANQGASWDAVRSTVLTETALFVRRVPDIVSLCFSDGTPFCSETTKLWLASESVQSLFASGAGNGQSAIKVEASADPVEEERKQAAALVAEGKIEDAIDLVQRNVRTSHSERDSFRRSILVASLLLQAKQPDIAVSVLEMVDQKTTTYNISVWEPDLAVEAWSALVAAYKAARAGKPPNTVISLQEKQNSILTKLSYIDPKKALLLNR